MSIRFSRRQALAALPLLLSARAQAAQWPSKQVTLVIPFTPGNTADLVARVLSEPLRRALGQPVIVDNRPGAGGNLAVQSVARAEKDGHTLLVSTGGPVVVSPAIYKNPGFNAEKDLMPIAIVGSIPLVLVANPDLPAKTLPELLDYARANSATVSYASTGQGTFAHFCTEIMLQAADLKLTHVPYKGSVPAHTDLVGGRVAFMFDSIAAINGLVQAGRVKALAVTSPKRSPFLMEVPTVSEAGGKLVGFDITAWTGVFAPTGTPAEVSTRMNAEVRRLLLQPEFRAQLAAQLIRADDPMTPQQFTDKVNGDRTRYEAIARAIGLERQ